MDRTDRQTNRVIRNGQIDGPTEVLEMDRQMDQQRYKRWTDRWTNRDTRDGQIDGPTEVQEMNR